MYGQKPGRRNKRGVKGKQRRNKWLNHEAVTTERTGL
ncbi:hypothetical protein EYZ11_012065 [Aspergillus tanneri]|uniref:Uncharacterized protein n=1 Tax=Aspergillus tanneri TaxID=1220188 RepID=A0A4S3J187_9EURO|nr:hypothetical protein EYZ11_012065 [Aspergillus tanneri]